MKSLYFNEDLNGILDSLNIREVRPELNKKYINSMITERNLNMFHGAQAELDRGGVFIAVGAAHLGGELGLLNLLKNAGYKILPALYEVYNPMPYQAAREMEVELAICLREAGYGVWQA